MQSQGPAGVTFHGVGRPWPASVRHERERLLLRHGIRKLLNELDHWVGLLPRRNPAGGIRDEREPVGGGSMDEDAVDGVLEAADTRTRGPPPRAAPSPGIKRGRSG